ncbi:hypothetical protein V496_10324 [Pseudogymnoascus sp. VKM F-4515 (FW-2607)]|nr:hypothetical protein V496_10324 [Pseudogymnoascus sp. VKM F-4515 (FW-2607)]KFY87548.1 hypothetical protein V498_07124 [Pseudogymnoascus sp. VKM F-4517 (FW-2822)]
MSLDACKRGQKHQPHGKYEMMRELSRPAVSQKNARWWPDPMEDDYWMEASSTTTWAWQLATVVTSGEQIQVEWAYAVSYSDLESTYSS